LPKVSAESELLIQVLLRRSREVTHVYSSEVTHLIS
jgi:hypothetical protein